VLMMKSKMPTSRKTSAYYQGNVARERKVNTHQNQGGSD
jgi:hypothetical protein